MKIPFSYSIRNIWARKLTTLLTAGGMALVVFVYAAVLMLDEGLRTTLVQTGSYDNVVLIRKGAETEVQSGVSREQASVLETEPEVAIANDGTPRASKEVVVLISLKKIGTDALTNIVVRGLSQRGIDLRPRVKLAAGRWFKPGSSEIVAGRAITGRFEGAGIGEHLRFGGRDWTIVGSFDAGNSGFDSELWGNADQLMQNFRRESYSSVIVKLNDSSAFERFKTRIESDPRQQIGAKREANFYADQSKALSGFISYLGITLSIIFSIGAMIGAMITMYAAVANRVAEIGTLRALGFKRSGVLTLFLIESLGLSLVGGLMGLAAASFMQLITISTMNWTSFSELAFSFTLTPKIAAQTIAFSLLMGFIGGFLPSLRAARMKIVDSLRAA